MQGSLDKKGWQGNVLCLFHFESSIFAASHVFSKGSAPPLPLLPTSPEPPFTTALRLVLEFPTQTDSVLSFYC